jgi:putative CocE/NonD family hydrolase
MKKCYYLLLLLGFTFTLYAQEDAAKIRRDSIAFTQNYVTEHTLIPLPDRDSLSVIIVRDRRISTPQPTVLMYSIYAGKGDERRVQKAAVYGYTSVLVSTRGKNKSSSSIAPFEHDSKDATAVLDWICRQEWSNKKIGMYGGSYLGFSQWATAKTRHPALKTIVPQAAVGIGIDFPMYNGIFMNYSLRWIKYVTNSKQTDETIFTNKGNSTLNSFYWFKKGLPFSRLDSISGATNSVFQRWINNPLHNAYWQEMVPYKEEFADITIPVLSITGYYDADQLGALYYYKENHKYNNNPNHYLIIGPYDHYGPQGVISKKLQGYTLDEAANINIDAIVFKWFDYILKDGPKPEFLKDKVNYQVMDSNSWKHASSLAAMNNDTLTFYLSNLKVKDGYLLSGSVTTPAAIDFEVNFKKRKGNTYYRSRLGIVHNKISRKNNLQFISEPLKEALDINGSFLGELHATINKKDMDVVVDLYELKEDGTYFDLSYYLGRASHSKDKEKRQLLSHGIKESIPITNATFTSKHIAKGSRLVVTLGINYNAHYQVNYGTGKDVSDESIADATEPLKIQWHTDSFIKIPIWRDINNAE